MENRTGILRNAPTGIKLYSPAFGDCKLSCVIEDEMTIECFNGKGYDYITLDKYGRFKEDGECILYPNKYKHDWNGWQEWLFRDEQALGQVVVDDLGGCFIIINNSDDIKVADASGKEHILESKESDKFRFATQAERIEFFEYLERNNCHWDNEAKAILKNTKKEKFIEEPKEFCDEDAKEAANIWCRCFKCDGIVNETGLKCDKTRLLTCSKWYDSYKASLIALETYNRKLKENKEPKELYTDEEDMKGE